MAIDLMEYRPEKVVIDTVTGVVAGASTRTVSTQNISTSGGSGGFYVGNVYFNDPVRVTSSTDHTTIIEFFLQTDDGKEVPVRLRNIDFQVRDGHVVSVQTASLPDGTATMLALGNHTTGMHEETPRWEAVLFYTKPKLGCILSLLMAFGLMMVWVIVGVLLIDIAEKIAKFFIDTYILVPIAVFFYQRKVNDRSKERAQMRADVLARAAQQYADEREAWERRG